jgi:hypothetical protein
VGSSRDQSKVPLAQAIPERRHFRQVSNRCSRADMARQAIAPDRMLT